LCVAGFEGEDCAKQLTCNMDGNDADIECSGYVGKMLGFHVDGVQVDGVSLFLPSANDSFFPFLSFPFLLSFLPSPFPSLFGQSWYMQPWPMLLRCWMGIQQGSMQSKIDV